MVLEAILAIIGMCVLVAGQYYSPNFCRSRQAWNDKEWKKKAEVAQDRIRERRQREHERRERFDPDHMPLDRLRILDRAFRGTELGKEVHEIRERRVLAAYERHKRRRTLLREAREGIARLDLTQFSNAELERFPYK